VRVVFCFVVLAISASAQTILPQLFLNTQVISLAAPLGSTKPVVQTVMLSASGPPVSFNAFTSTPEWLSVSPASGTTPATLTISADGSKLPAGTYYGQVNVTAGTLATYARVMFTVGAGSAGSLLANPSMLTFIGQSSQTILPAQTLNVSNAKGVSGAVAFNVVASSSGWLLISTQNATTPATVSVSAISFGLLPGTYTGTVTLTPVGVGTPTVVPVVLAVSGTGAGAASIQLSQSSLILAYQIGTSEPPLQVVHVDVVASSANTFTASTTTSWLRLVSLSNPNPVASLTDFLPGDLSVQVNPAGLLPGSYVGSVTIEAPGLPAQQLPVLLTITGAPSLNAQPSSILFNDLGNTMASVTVSSTGSASLSFTATPSVGWLSVTPSSGSTAGASQVLMVSANAAGLAAGTYSGAVILSVQNNGAIVKIPVQFTVSGSGQAPELQSSVTAVDLTGVVGMVNPLQVIRIDTSTPGATQDFTAAAISNEGWLTVAPFMGTASANVTITASADAVPGPSMYSGSVVITSLLTGDQMTIPVRFTLAQQAIMAAPTSLTFAQQQTGTKPADQTIQVSGNAPSTFTATADSTWIRISQASGSTPATLTVSVDPSGLAPGTSNGTIQITGPKNQLSIPVSLTVPEPPGPNVTPASITLTYELGNPTSPSQSISIGSTGAPVSFTAKASTDSGVDWLTVQPTSGVTNATVTAKVNTALLVPGQQSGRIAVASTDGAVQRTVPVTVNVSSSVVAVRDLLHGATLAPTPLAPGLIITITGTGLGPATGVAARPTAAGAIESSLADTHVLFDGIPAPLLYARTDQINAIVPYALYGRLSTQVQVQVGASFSLPIQAKLVDSAPGLFTIVSSGGGQAAALNSDLTVNSLANPAPRGSVISVYGTGEGQTDPPGQDGRIILTDLRRPRLPVTALVGGRPAEVTYAGSSPMQVSGAFQVNVRLPQDIEPGATSIQLQVGDAATQSGVTIAVR
jgi:uncharacterized protein (TIGR03437 family)